MRRLRMWILMVLGVLSCNPGSWGSETWLWRRPATRGESFVAGLSGPGTYRVASTEGTLWSSTNGAEWQVDFTSLPGSLTALAQGNGRLLGVGADGSFRLLTSGNSGVEIGRVEDFFAQSACYGNGIFVVAGQRATELAPQIYTSSDGATWTLRALPHVEIALDGVCFGGGQFVAVGTGGFGEEATSAILRSRDGTNWSTGRTGIGEELRSVVFVGKQFLAVGRRTIDVQL
jgi:hypothetical protein